MSKIIFNEENTDKKINKRHEKVEKIINKFIKKCEPLEKEIYVITDYCTNTYYVEVHVPAESIINYSTIDVPIDPEDQGDYRANRDVVEDHAAFYKMKEDAKNGRTFSNIVAEYDYSYKKETPIKIIGGQHRFKAIQEAMNENEVNCHHGLKLYFDLESEQRLDVQLISNTNIDVSSDLLDRMFETLRGPELRDWCQKVGLLEKGQDFADKKSRSNQITVRMARSFIMSYFNGVKEKDNVEKFSELRSDTVIAKTGSIDHAWEELKQTESDLWENKKLAKAAKEFALLHKNQKSHFEKEPSTSYESINKVLNYAIISSWAYVAGLLQKNKIRLTRHFEIKEIVKTDPINARALQSGRHKTDPDNYRGLGSRTDAKERGRLVEVFFIQAEKGSGITKQVVDFGIKQYQAKLAVLEVKEAESKI